ncbi:protein disulfide oxidoreductase [Limnochorda pilosa]|uniref:Glutaredoxin n=1 Tax=Limnochorda pilosa TaxID=1555112 RepID=A0A0K2SML5_LIMPI|nr:thioredoxin family protein [Limnochorda pilosa]BAS28242.1 glutaredoxin [Limnochorda pilosa]
MSLLSEKDAQYVRSFFEENLENPVEMLLFTAAEGDELAERKNPYLKETLELIEAVAGLSDKLSVRVLRQGTDDELFEAYGIHEIPATVLLGPAETDYGIRFYGIPAGYEFRSLMDDLVDVSKGETRLSAKTKETLQTLAADAHFQVFVTPTCPYCPKAVRLAHQFAIESPRVRADMVEATEFPDWAGKYNVYGVPKTVINDVEEIEGALPEEMFVDALMRAAAVKA